MQSQYWSRYTEDHPSPSWKRTHCSKVHEDLLEFCGGQNRVLVAFMLSLFNGGGQRSPQSSTVSLMTGESDQGFLVGLSSGKRRGSAEPGPFPGRWHQHSLYTWDTRTLRGEIFFNQLSQTDDGCQDVIEVMGDAPRECADSLHLWAWWCRLRDDVVGDVTSCSKNPNDVPRLVHRLRHCTTQGEMPIFVRSQVRSQGRTPL